ncbi:MAG: DNA replication/repair protein RecF [Chloroflexi bacterium]|nr:DNA replication/repair protein RecF [Chloroflexota bacterium]
MHIRYLSLTNFRNYARLELALPRSALLLHGANAQGKTNILEAIYLLSSGTSPLTSSDREMIKWETEKDGLTYARVWAEVVRSQQVQEIEVILEKKPLTNGSERLQKTLRVDRVRKRRSEFTGRLNVVLFMPQDMDLIAGPPAQRRHYLDETLCQVDGVYADALDSYGEALRQRNAALRYIREQSGDITQLVPFEEVIAYNGARIVEGRYALLNALSEIADRIHRQLTGASDWLRLDYQPSLAPVSPAGSDAQLILGPTLTHGPHGEKDLKAQEDSFQRALEACRSEDIARGTTSIGPHRDELRIVSGNPVQGTHEVDLGTYGSRGQQRTAVLALKLAELEWLRIKTGDTPVLLLDEVLAELDASRRHDLISRVSSVEQAVLTATDLDMFSQTFRDQARLCEVQAGIVRTG